jgi:hypothetical protein
MNCAWTDDAKLLNPGLVHTDGLETGWNDSYGGRSYGNGKKGGDDT